MARFRRDRKNSKIRIFPAVFLRRSPCDHREEEEEEREKAREREREKERKREKEKEDN